MVILARSASVPDFGQLAVVLAVSYFLQALFDLGLTTLIIREQARGKDLETVRAALRLNTASSVGLGIIAAAGLALASSQNDIYVAMLPLAVGVAAEKAADTRASLALASGRPQISAATLVLRRFMHLFSLPLFLTGLGPIAAYSASAAVAGLSSLLLVTWKARALSVATERIATVPRTLALARPFWVHSLATQARNVDALFVGALAGPAQVAYYGLTVRLASPLRIVPASLSAVLLPKTSKEGYSGLKAHMRYGGIACAALCVLLAPVAYWAEPLLQSTAGSNYAVAAPTLQVLCLVTVLAAASAFQATALQAVGHARTAARASVGGTLLVLAGVAWGAVHAGALGAMIGSALGHAAQVLVLARVILKLRGRTRGPRPAAAPA